MFSVLTPREAEIARDLALGRTCREIARRLGISVKTVDSHRNRLLKKLQTPNNVTLARLALSQGFVTLNEV
jgi:DNA-binding NarL/FixJ family response regulator